MNLKEKKTNKHYLVWLAIWILLVLGLTAVVWKKWQSVLKSREQSRIVSAQKAEEGRMKARLRNAMEQVCRELWAGKERVPVKGGGWIDTRKVPYDFLLMQQDDDGAVQ